ASRRKLTKHWRSTDDLAGRLFYPRNGSLRQPYLTPWGNHTPPPREGIQIKCKAVLKARGFYPFF
ncbi:hypothetical protein, partial [Microcoleus sp. OTE_8_concoct_300]|uniref:hypothetical protein n=1 Tax=Microcoleus sp. OTE_8_concoct_300 TaxID=2964710 RepID=UPI00403F3B3D